MGSRLRFLVSGPGLIGKKHASLIQGRADCELAALVGPATDENAGIARELAAPLFSTVEDVLSRGGIDAAIISSPNEFHYAQALACIDHRVPALVEKPLTDSSESARALAERAERGGVPVLVGHHRTYSPLLSAADAFLRSGKFGRMVAFQGSALFYKPQRYFEEGPWRTRPGGGPILINLIHEIGLMRHFCGEITRLSAIASNAVRGFAVEDTVAISLAFTTGALGTFLLSDAAASSKSWEMTSCENPSYPAFPTDSCYHFAGTNGSLDFPSMQARFYDGEPSWWRPFTSERLPLAHADPLEQQLAHFVAVIRGEERPRVSARDGYRNVLVVDAIARSIAAGAAVDIPAA